MTIERYVASEINNICHAAFEASGGSVPYSGYRLFKKDTVDRIVYKFRVITGRLMLVSFFLGITVCLIVLRLLQYI